MKVGNVCKWWIQGLVLAAVWAPAVSEGQIPRPVERLGRVHGFGWGDGYHTCKPSGIRLIADLPPRSQTQSVAPKRGKTFYDRFDAQNCDQPGCDGCASTMSFEGSPTVFRDSVVIETPAPMPVPTPAAEPNSVLDQTKPVQNKTVQNKTIEPKSEVPKSAPTKIPAPTPELPEPNSLPAPANTDSSQSFWDFSDDLSSNSRPRPIRPAAPTTEPRKLEAVLAANRRMSIGFDGQPIAEPRLSLSATPNKILPKHPGSNPLSPQHEAAAAAQNSTTPAMPMPQPKAANQKLVEKTAKRVVPAKPEILRPKRLGGSELPQQVTSPIHISRSQAKIQGNPFATRPALELARRRENAKNSVIYQPTQSMLK
ncbi:MAG: hypothetical protein AB8B91_01120 [Rubripirellula sp.]